MRSKESQKTKSTCNALQRKKYEVKQLEDKTAMVLER